VLGLGAPGDLGCVEKFRGLPDVEDIEGDPVATHAMKSRMFPVPQRGGKASR
jgi:hypothetical protein